MLLHLLHLAVILLLFWGLFHFALAFLLLKLGRPLLHGLYVIRLVTVYLVRLDKLLWVTVTLFYLLSHLMRDLLLLQY